MNEEKNMAQLAYEWVCYHRNGDAFTLNLLDNLLDQELKKRIGEEEPTQEQIYEVFDFVISEGGF